MFYESFTFWNKLPKNDLIFWDAPVSYITFPQAGNVIKANIADSS